MHCICVCVYYYKIICFGVRKKKKKKQKKLVQAIRKNPNTFGIVGTYILRKYYIVLIISKKSIYILKYISMYLYIYVCVCLHHYEYTSTKQTHDHFEQQLYIYIPYMYTYIESTYTLYTYTLYTHDLQLKKRLTYLHRHFLLLLSPHTQTHTPAFSITPGSGKSFKILDG